MALRDFTLSNARPFLCIKSMENMNLFEEPLFTKKYMARLHISVAENSNYRNQEVKDFNSLIQVWEIHMSLSPQKISKKGM